MAKYESYWELVDPIWDAVSIYDGGEVFVKQYAIISPTQRVLFASHWAYSEIQNGGLHQFFLNSTGVLAPEAVASFKELSMGVSAGAIASAMEFFGDDYPRDKATRNELLDAYENKNPDAWNPFEQLDDLFFDNVDTECDGFEIAANRFANRPEL